MNVRSLVSKGFHRAEALVQAHTAPKPKGQLERTSTKHAVLERSGFKTGAAAIDRAVKAGTLTPVSLDALPLNQSYTATHPTTGMAHQAPAGFVWNKTDASTPEWYPQAVTTSSDATASGRIGGKDWIAVSWHSKDGDRSRISLVDYTKPSDPKQAKYRNIELVEPDPKHPGKFRAVKSHVGGMSWVGHYLYVAQTGGGLRVFDLNKLSHVKDPKAVDAKTKFVLPQVGWYRISDEVKGKPGAPVFSGLSLDRKTGTLISQEYRGDKTGGRIMRWPIDLKTGLLKEKGGEVKATEAFSVPLTRVAGVVSRGDGFDIATMGNPSRLYRATEGKTPQAKDTFAQGIQQFSWDAQRGQIWTLDEHPNRRAVWHFKPE